MGMRVITPCGLGKARAWGFDVSTVEVELDLPFAGEKVHRLKRGREVFPLSDLAAVRVLNVSGVGWLSNFQFHETPADAKIRLLLPAPPDETTFLFNLKSGEAEVSQELGLRAVEGFLLMRPWLDRWGQEHTDLFETEEEALAAADGDLERVVGAGGISTMLLLDIQRKRLLRFALFTMQVRGAVLSRKY